MMCHHAGSTEVAGASRSERVPAAVRSRHGGVSRAACAQENGEIFEALRTMSAYFLRADAHSICECIQAFGLDGLLFAIVASDNGGAGGFPAGRDGSPARPRPGTRGGAPLSLPGKH